MSVKRPWTLDEWEAYGKRCQALRDRLTGLTHSIPPTPGLTAEHWNAFIRTHKRLVTAMHGLVPMFLRQHREIDLEPGVSATRFLCGTPANWEFTQGCPKQDAPILSREQWVEIGREVKAIDAELGAISMMLQETTGASISRSDLFWRAEMALNEAKSKLDSLVCEQHPEWKDFIAVFYGREDPCDVTPHPSPGDIR